LSIRSAWAQSPGPKDAASAARLSLKGFGMGVADIIPGVSGGTIAFITGIYDQLVDAIRSVDMNGGRKLIGLDIAGFIEHVHCRFLFFFLMGIGGAIVSMARVMNHLMTAYPVPVWSLFFGLIAASSIVVGRKVERFTAVNAAFCLVGLAAGFSLVGMIPVHTPETLWFLFLCGAIAICAMILPGISGAFILLMLGKYEFVTAALKNPFVWSNLEVILVFLGGACIGIVVFSRLLHYLLSRWHGATVSVLTGLMLGAMRKVWPWKEVLESVMVRGKEHVLRAQNVLPDLNGDLWAALALMAFGAAVVFFLDRVSRHS
jgi:putative membrane protein